MWKKKSKIWNCYVILWKFYKKNIIIFLILCLDFRLLLTTKDKCNRQDLTLFAAVVCIKYNGKKNTWHSFIWMWMNEGECKQASNELTESQKEREEEVERERERERESREKW